MVRGHASGGHTRAGHDPRHAERRVVDEDAVRALAVLAEALAVIGRDEHDRAVHLALVVERLKQPARADGRRMRSRRRTVSHGSARPDRRPAARTARADRSSAPRGTRGAAVRSGRLDGCSHRSTASVVASADPLDVRGPAQVVPAWQVVVVGVEPAIEPEAAIEREPGDERRRAISRLPEILGGRASPPARSTNPLLFRNPWPSGVRPVRIRRVRRTGQWRMGDRCLRNARRALARARSSASSQPDVRSTRVVRAQRVNRHEQHVGAFRRRGGRRPVTPATRQPPPIAPARW